MLTIKIHNNYELESRLLRAGLVHGPITYTLSHDKKTPKGKKTAHKTKALAMKAGLALLPLIKAKSLLPYQWLQHWDGEKLIHKEKIDLETYQEESV